MDGETLAEVIRGAQRGDPVSFDRLVDAFAGRIFGFLLRLTGSRDAAEDLMQEVFIRVVRMIGSYEHADRFEAWVFRIAANLARDRLRRTRRAPRRVTMAAPGGIERGGLHAAGSLEEIAAEPQAADAGLVRGEEIDALNAALAMLPETEREVIMLRHFSQMSFKEIAEVMDTPLGTALARAHRGLARLRELMDAPHQRAAECNRAARPS
ncbi:MAG: sigma-70 family RNA polymerase sigma factor [Phycisphaerae bacterium]|nr:sigma-70 family RNA polymerase sigma factor [Phycisphaerae bacterium]